MHPVWKALLVLALVLPVAAFVVGSLASSAADEPARRDPIVIREAPADPTGSPSPTRAPRTPERTDRPTPPTPDRQDGRDDGGGVVVITPEPGEVDDDGDDSGDDDDGSDDGSDGEGDDD